MIADKRKIILRIIIIIAIFFITAVLFIYRDQIQKLSNMGYWGIFFISIFSNATLILPLPGVVLTSAMGAIFNPFWVALASASGATLGEITGYLAGFSGQIIVDRKEWYERLFSWMSRYGGITILVMAFVPNPIFDLAGMAAGMLKMPLFKFFFWCWLGKLLKMLLFAYTGASLYHLVYR